MLDGIAEAILKGTQDMNGLDDEQKERVNALAHFVTQWSKINETERDNNLPSYDDLNEAFLNEDLNSLHTQALKVRVALSEIDANILSHIRRLIVVADSLAQYRNHPDDEDNLPAFLKVLDPEDRDSFIEGVIISEVTGIAMQTIAYDNDHAKENH